MYLAGGLEGYAWSLWFSALWGESGCLNKLLQGVLMCLPRVQGSCISAVLPPVRSRERRKYSGQGARCWLCTPPEEPSRSPSGRGLPQRCLEPMCLDTGLPESHGRSAQERAHGGRCMHLLLQLCYSSAPGPVVTGHLGICCLGPRLGGLQSVTVAPKFLWFCHCQLNSESKRSPIEPRLVSYLG